MVSMLIDRRKLLSFIMALPFLSMTSVDASSNQPPTCEDVRYLIEQSKSQFAAIRGGSDHQFGGFETTFTLPDVWYCGILEDVEKWSYRCVWKYPLGDEQARTAYQDLSTAMKACIGDIAEEQVDQTVNHPDIYQSRYYQLPKGALNINLKNKADLESTLVSMRIDGAATTK